MNKIIISITMIGYLTLGFSSQISLDQQINRIKEAPEKDRFELMNKFKKEISQMKISERRVAIKELQKNMNHNQQNMQEHSMENMNHNQQNIQEHSMENMNHNQQNMQEHSTENMNHNQQNTREIINSQKNR